MTTAAAAEAPPSPARPTAPQPTLVHSGANVDRYYAQHFQGAVFPVAAGLLLYGWRALVVIAVVVASAAAATLVWRQVGRRGRDLSVPHTMWLALVLALMLPAHLATRADLASLRGAFWLLPAAGVLLSAVLWLLRGAAGSALHPAVVAYLLLVPLCEPLLAPQLILHRDHLVFGDVLDAPASADHVSTEPWWYRRGTGQGERHAIRARPASEALLSYTWGGDVPERGALLLQGLLRERVAPLEDLVMAGNPGPIGMGSVIFVIIGGLFLLYRGVIDYRIPLLVALVAFVALLVLPVPVSISEHGPRWAWLALREPSVGWAVGITFANYELAASPLLFVAFFLATNPAARPMTRRGRVAFAMTIGLLAAALQLYVSVSWGPYLALLMAGLLTPVADRLFLPKPLA